MRYRLTGTLDDLMRVFAIRAIVFVHEQRCPYAEEFDGLDIGATQVLGESGGEPMGCGRIRFIDGWAKLERLALLPAARGQGHGHALLRFMMKQAQTQGATRLKLHAQAHLVGFYEAHGFVARGDPFVEAGIEHRLMTLDNL